MGRYGITVRGLVIAGIGFGLSRFTVTLAATETTEQFLFTGLVPLVLGLLLSAFGVVLAVGAYDRMLVRTTMRWCVLGTVTMAVLAAVTALGMEPALLSDPDAIRQQAYLSNFVIGGAVGGTLTGLYASRARNQRVALKQQANRLTLLNRLLRDQIINSAMAIKGHAGVLKNEYSDESVGAVDRQADDIVDVIENVKYLSGTADSDDFSLVPIDLNTTVESALEATKAEHPDAVCGLDLPEQSIEVQANSQLSEVFRHLFENAVQYNDAETPQLDVTVETTTAYVSVRVADNGPGLPADQQALLERGEIAEYDDPTTGFGLNIVRLLVEGFDGDIETTVTDNGTTVEIRLPRVTEPNGQHTNRGISRVSRAHTVLSLPVGVVSGITMGIAMTVTGFDLEAIGALYGIQDVIVALITHEFHSVVFALFYAAVLVVVPRPHGDRLISRLGIGIAFGLALWVFAAGAVMPLWLRAVGIEAPLPNIPLPSLLGHLVWGVTTGLLYHAGDGWLTGRNSPWI